MSKKQEWPRWIRITYYVPTHEEIRRYLGCANDTKMLFDNLDRLDITKSQVIQIFSNDELLMENEVESLFAWIEKKRKERKEDEERKEAEQQSKKGNGKR